MNVLYFLFSSFYIFPPVRGWGRRGDSVVYLSFSPTYHRNVENYFANEILVFAFRFSDLTGTDYSERAIDLARSLAERDGMPDINFLVYALLFWSIFCYVSHFE